MRTRLGLLVVLIATLAAACAGAIVQTVTESDRPSTASPQALAFFDAMVRAADSTGLEQAACVSRWTFSLRDDRLTMHIERVRAATVHRAHPDSVRFECYEAEGTVHTHAYVCRPSDVDREGAEMFGVVVCPNPTRFAVFAVTPCKP